MGVGKSTVGRKLAKKLKFKFSDIDRLIEKKEKATIREIFKNKKEYYFRKIEKEITLEELKKTNLVIALGGGAYMNKTIRKEVKNSAISFFLDLNLNALLSRLNNVKKRPLLMKDSLKENINKIYSERKKIYNESDFKIKCNSMGVDKVVNKVIKLYEKSGN